MRSLLEQCRLYSHRQQQLGKQARTAELALSAVIGVYSAQPTAPLSLLARVKNFDAGRYRALEQKRVAVRLGAMRGTIHLLPRPTAPTVFAATIGQDPKMLALRLQIARVTPAEYAKFKRHVLDKVHEPINVRALRQATGEKKAALGTLLRAMSDEGLVLRVGPQGLRSNDLNYVPLKTWLGSELPVEDKEKSLTWLASEYLRAFGPARIQDLQWWVGIKKGPAVKALEGVESVDVGDGCLLLKKQLRAFEEVKPFASDVIDVIPKWDCYEMGYAPDGRGRFVTPDRQMRLYDLVGDGVGAILLNGLAIAAWDLRGEKDTLAINIDWFEKPTARLKQQVVDELGRLAVFLESKGATIQHLGDEQPGRALGRMR